MMRIDRGINIKIKPILVLIIKVEVGKKWIEIGKVDKILMKILHKINTNNRNLSLLLLIVVSVLIVVVNLESHIY
jgi:hypothetical protein